MSRYEKTFHSTSGQEFRADVYSVLQAFNVTCPARQHAIKKLLMPGQRGSKGEVQDLEEARTSVARAIDMAWARRRDSHGASDEPEPEPDGEKRLYIWHEFAPDYRHGLAVAIASSEAEARRLVVSRLRFDPDDWGPLTTCTLNATATAWAVTGGQ